MNPKTNIYLLAVILVCRAMGIASAETKHQPPAAAPESAAAPTKQPQPAVQEDLGCVVIDGKTNRVVSVNSADPVSVHVIYECADGARGGRKIPRQELPPQLQAKYPYDADKAADYRKQQADQAVEQAALAARQAAKARAATVEGLRQQEKQILAQIDRWQRRDVELQKEKKILNGLPPGNGRRVRAKQINNEQQSIREQNKRLNDQLEKIRTQIAGMN
jgi:hypothetical protein